MPTGVQLQCGCYQQSVRSSFQALRALVPPMTCRQLSSAGRLLAPMLAAAVGLRSPAAAAATAATTAVTVRCTAGRGLAAAAAWRGVHGAAAGGSAGRCVTAAGVSRPHATAAAAAVSAPAAAPEATSPDSAAAAAGAARALSTASAGGAAGLPSVSHSSAATAPPPLPEPAPPGVLVTYYADHWKVPLPPGHRFPMEKYAAVHAALAADPSLAATLQLRPAPPVAWADVTAVHCPAYVERFRSNRMTELEMRNVGFPWSEQLVGRTFASCGGTVAATHCVLQRGRGIAANIAGGTHHAFRDRGEGFCIFNDIAVAAAVALRDYGLTSILVIDLDVHQGNGTAEIFQADPRVTTFDVFGDRNYPWKTRRRNTYDIPLEDGTGDEEYLGLLRSWLPRLLSDHAPQLIMFQAGVDALKGDGFGRLGLSRGGLLARNNLLYGAALEAGAPMVISMGGGYTRPMDASVEAHTDVYRTAAYRLAAWEAAAGGKGTAAGRAAAAALEGRAAR